MKGAEIPGSNFFDSDSDNVQSWNPVPIPAQLEKAQRKNLVQAYTNWVYLFCLSVNRCKTPPTRNNTIVSVSSTERLHGTSVLRNRVSMKVAYRVGSVLKYRCKRGFLLQVSLGPTARPASEQLRVTTRRVRRFL